MKISTMSAMNGNKRVIWPDNAKVIAIGGVIFLHISIRYLMAGDGSGWVWWLGNILILLYAGVCQCW